MRRASMQREKMHRKKLYCIHCQKVINHVECKTQEEVEQFFIDFNSGDYQDEAIESMAFCERS